MEDKIRGEDRESVRQIFQVVLLQSGVETLAGNWRGCGLEGGFSFLFFSGRLYSMFCFDGNEPMEREKSMLQERDWAVAGAVFF